MSGALSARALALALFLLTGRGLYLVILIFSSELGHLALTANLYMVGELLTHSIKKHLSFFAGYNLRAAKNMPRCKNIFVNQSNCWDLHTYSFNIKKVGKT